MSVEVSYQEKLESRLAEAPARIIACSGGVDSMTLATVAHRLSPASTKIAHAISPAVPQESTNRVENWARVEGWDLEIVRSGEFDSESYLSNPVDRCYFCKSNLYEALDRIAFALGSGATLMSGANEDDLGEYRPGLVAASENEVRHPFIEAGIAKDGVRSIARSLGLPFAELPASPCLASRLYTGTRVTEERLRAVESGEALIRSETGIEVVRCRIREGEMFVEVRAEDREKITPDLLASVAHLVRTHDRGLARVVLDPDSYRPGRAFVATVAAE